jgi:hypothetical protein
MMAGAIPNQVNPTGLPRPDWWEESHRLLREFIADEKATGMLTASVRDGTIHAGNESMDRFTLPRESGESAYHKIGKYVGHSWVDDLGFAVIRVNGGQFRWLSPPGRYSQRIQFVHCRGRKYPGYIQVNFKGEETRGLTEANAKLAGAQLRMLLDEGDNEPIPLDSSLTIWVIEDVYRGGVVCVYLAVAMRLSKNGRRLVDLEDVHLLDEFDLGGGGAVFGAPLAPAPAPETEPATVVVEDL